jgi:hypothetical protein
VQLKCRSRKLTEHRTDVGGLIVAGVGGKENLTVEYTVIVV